MGLSIENEKAEQLARETAALEGESSTEAILVARRERRERHRAEDLAQALLDLGRRFRRRLIDPRAADDILYDELGRPQ